MARASGQKQYITLAKGLFTEASQLAFPDGATSDELNFVVDKKGLVRQRRKGFTNIYNERTVDAEGGLVENSYYWRKAGVIIVSVTDDTPSTRLRFHAVGEGFEFLTEVVIADAKVASNISDSTDMLFVALSDGSEPLLLEYIPGEDRILVNRVTLYIRDLELLDDGLSLTDRPVTDIDNHIYNVYNAGWATPRAMDSPSTSTTPAGSNFKTATGVWPSNADILALGETEDTNGDTVISSTELQKTILGNTEAPRGHYIYPITDIDRDAKLADPLNDGSPPSTLTLLGTVELSGVPRYDPEVPSDGDTGTGGTGGGYIEPGFEPYPKPGYELP